MAVLLPVVIYGAIIFMVILYIKFLISRRHLYKFAASIPGIPCLPFIGNAFTFYGDLWEGVLKSFEYYNEDGLTRIWFGPVLAIAVTNPEWVKFILNNKLEKDEYVYKYFKPFLGNGIFTAPVSAWKSNRKLLLPAFNKKILDDFVESFNKHSIILVENLSQQIGQGEFAISSYLFKVTFDMVCENMTGVEINTQCGKNADILNAFKNEMEIVKSRSTRLWLWPQAIFNLTKYRKIQEEDLKILNKFITDIIERKMSAFESKNDLQTNPTETKTFLDMVIELNMNEKHLNVQMIKNETLTMLLGGTETSAITESYVFVLLGQYQDIQNKIVEELNSIFGDSKRYITIEDLHEMKYLERVILETLRLFPIAPLIYRHIEKDTQIGNYTFPAGTTCSIPIYKIHRDKKEWGDDPEKFDPDRFLPENSKDRHPYSFLPFSGGVRNCIGKRYGLMSMKILIATVLRSYKINTTLDLRKAQFELGVFLTPKSGYLISIEPRTSL